LSIMMGFPYIAHAPWLRVALFNLWLFLSLLFIAMLFVHLRAYSIKARGVVRIGVLLLVFGNLIAWVLSPSYRILSGLSEYERVYYSLRVRGHYHLVHVNLSLNLVGNGTLKVIWHPLECFEVEANISKLCSTCSIGIKVRSYLAAKSQLFDVFAYFTWIFWINWHWKLLHLIDFYFIAHIIQGTTVTVTNFQNLSLHFVVFLHAYLQF
jgi:hypothetical protein